MKRSPFSGTGHTPGNAAARKRRNSQAHYFVYFLTLIGFAFLVVSQATTSWTIVDNYKDFVYPDEHQGLWQVCFGQKEYECSPRNGPSWVYVVRTFDLLAFLIFAIVMGIFITSHINKNVKPSLAAGFLLLAALLTLIAMIVYTAKAPLPRTVDRNRNPYVKREFKIRYGYSYMIGWASLLLTFMAGIVSLILHRWE